MEDLLRDFIRGFPVGCVYALVATGLVLTFKTSGVFNLAFGAQAFVSAAVFYELRIEQDWPLAVAAGLSLALGPLLGWVLDRALFRHLRTASTVAKLVSSLGLLLAVPNIVGLFVGTGTKFNPPSIAVDAGGVYRLGDYSISADELMTVVVTLVVVAGLTCLFRFTALGLSMRAVVESPRMVELAGINADRVGTAAWVLSSFIAGLAGLLLAPLFGNIDQITFTILIVAATAAAAFGRLSSLPLTLAGGLVLGVAQQVLGGQLPLDSVLARGLRPSLPFFMLFLLLLFWPGLRRSREASDPLSGVDPPPPALAISYADPRLAKVNRIAFFVFLGVVLLGALFVVGGFWLFLITQGIILTTIFLSITVLTGMSGQISLCQAVFAGVGTFTAAQLADDFGVPILGGMVIGAVVAAAVGAVVAIPALRLGGLYLGLATLAFALMFENVVFPLNWVSGGNAGVEVPRPVVGPIDFASDRAFFLLAFAVFGLSAAVVVLVRRGTTGRYLAALRGSEVAATAIGINPVRAKITVFALSAAIAGVGGTMLGSLQGSTTLEDYSAFIGLLWFVLVVTLGSRTVDGAVNAGMSFILLPELLDVLGVPSSKQIPIQFILFGFGAVTFAKHPEGIVEANKRKSLQRISAWVVRRFGEPPEVDDAPVDPTAEPVSVLSALESARGREEGAPVAAAKP
ncbi:MAG: ABC transporter permease [Acidimicrobiia bacterium]|nr:ABC transporter permease [Acidimicrobiia bacterium]